MTFKKINRFIEELGKTSVSEFYLCTKMYCVSPTPIAFHKQILNAEAFLSVILEVVVH